ncbi:Ribosome biogenesis ATPase rix7 [Conoideocrella luteorostrata]|uniref:Ribosome biogenesis ATPase rix7 n=1 Tax=Conoideocrella luteorostrata TaxID=1105319 RepID=A0AAJ0CGC2_9HYPO|nr:Ribosome biogenesis ATPase rix7 [Conoideocrella luteorostrata]
MTRPRVSLRSRIERDVYTVLKQLETHSNVSNATIASCDPFKSVTAAYDAIQRSNSSLKRQKKRPLEDAIDRVLLFRKQEADDSSDSEAAIEEAETTNQGDGRFLLNRQMTKFWHQDPPTTEKSTEPLPTKKRRIQDDGDDTPGQTVAMETSVIGDISGGHTASATHEKQQTKKSQKLRKFTVDHLEQEKRLGGLGGVPAELLNVTYRILKFPGYYEDNGWNRPTGILLSGPPGMGKTSLIKNVASTLGVTLVSLNGCFDDPERMLKSMADAFDIAISHAPSIIFIKDIDHYMARHGSSHHNDHHTKAVRCFSQQMERIQLRGPEEAIVMAMATTSKIADVNPNILKKGLFMRTEHIKIPDYESRKEVLQTITSKMTLGEDVDLDEIARITHGYVPGELALITDLATDVAASCLSEGDDTNVRGSELQAAISATEYEFFQPTQNRIRPKAPVSMGNFKAIIKEFTPSLRKEGFTIIPNVTWDQVGALDAARKQLHMSIIGPIKRPGLYKEFGLQPNAGVLLWGPPGCGKTLVAQAVANDAKASFILINGPELLNKYVGESERAVRELFQRARSSKPCILFFDEIDSVVPPRANSSTDSGARVVNALLTELDGAQDRSGVYVIGTTNRPEMIDEAILRPGRLGNQIFIDLPTPAERVDILRAIYRTRHENPSLVVIEDELAKVATDPRCTNFSGADLGGLHTKAAHSALERWMQDETSDKGIINTDWEFALNNTRASVKDPASYRERNLVL